jgi:hypothetical protein
MPFASHVSSAPVVNGTTSKDEPNTAKKHAYAATQRSTGRRSITCGVQEHRHG